ncbi:zinc-ribbon domain-containing protein [Bittarella massiliensis]|uniref:zinc-ribbon domain-containing protein n=1 Tax=Bittarella massiliensis (ex Durand et al. 2017) TaxID=1720313 RepID=UPI00163CAE8B|nr:zinc-ribbon domain-containing protein [Bittarella massiliensis (ex Durand et al. 2017)]MBC2870966.1 zinc-ribbon domain-containing protein [Bittarella massiliensis (ex Durand et al. 2017)]
MTCPNCGVDNAENSAFCKACGASLTGEQPASQAACQDGAMPSPYQPPVYSMYAPYLPAPRREYTWKDICTIVGFISSIAGLFTFWVVLCPMGLLTSCLGYRGNRTRGLAVAGIIISLLAIAIKIGFILYHLDVLPSWLTDGAL